MLHLSDYLVILLIIAAVFVPELLSGFKRGRATSRLVILAGFCIIATTVAVQMQHADVWISFTRSFLIAMSARISLLLNHIAEAMVQKLDKLNK